jgi:hypothetical protein
MKLIDRALALIGLRRIKRNVHVRIVGNPEDYRGIAEAMRRLRNASEIEWPESKVAQPVRLDVAGYRPADDSSPYAA